MNNVKLSAPPPTAGKKPDRPHINEELYRISRRFRTAKFITLLLLVCFVVGMVSANRSELTIENIRYLLRYLNADANVYSYSSEYKTISYSADSEIAFSVYRGDFVVADSTAVNIYASSGSNVLSSSSFITNPVVLTSGRHLIVYDLGGNSYAAYNTFSKIYGASLDYPITGGVNSDSGMYALITKTSEYRSAVFVYNEDGVLVSRVLKNKLIMDVDISDDSSRLLVASAYNDTSTGDFMTELLICEPATGTELQTTVVEDMMPLEAAYNSGGFYLLGDSAVLFYDSGGALVSRYDFNGAVPSSVTMTDDYIFVAFQENVVGNSQLLHVFNTSGEEVALKHTDGEIIRLLCENGEIYVLTDSKILRMPVNGDSYAEFTAGGNSIDLILARSDTLYLCYSSYASAIGIGDALSYEQDNA